jgi:hypothetical protein
MPTAPRPEPDTATPTRNGIGWSLHGDGRTVGAGAVVAPDERLHWPQTISIGVQHVMAMFGSTVLVPALTGFPVTTTLLFTGIGTLLFLLITANRIPSYLGSSFAFIAPVAGAMASHGIGGALGGIVVAGAALFIVGLIVQFTGTGWIHALMPPVVMGTIVALNAGTHAAGPAHHLRDAGGRGDLFRSVQGPARQAVHPAWHRDRLPGGTGAGPGGLQAAA